MKIIVDRVLHILYSIMLGFALNYCIYSFQNAIVWSVIPMLLVIFLFVRYLKKSEPKLWQYVCTVPIIIASYLFYSFMYLRGSRLSLTAAVLSFVLVLWSILCIEEKIAVKKEAIIYLAAFLVVYLAGGSFLWFSYNQKAAAAIDCLVKNADVSVIDDYESFLINAALEADGLCQEIDAVFYGSDKRYNLFDLAYNYCYHAESYRKEYYELLEKLEDSDYNKIKLLVNNVPFSLGGLVSP